MQKLIKVIKSRKFFFLFLLLNIVSFWKLLVLPHELAYGDLSPFHLSVTQAIQKFFYSWEDVGFGYSRSPGTLFPLIQALFLVVFRLPLIAQKVYLFLLPITSFLSFGYLLSSAKLNKNKFAAFISATLYAYAPVALGEFLGGTAYSTMLGFAFFPVLYANTYKLRQRFDLSAIILNGLFLGVLASVYAQLLVIFGVSLLVPFVVSLFSGWKKALLGWSRVALIGVIALLFNPILYLGSINLVSSQTNEGSASSFSGNAEFFLSNIEVTYKKSSIPTTLRLGNIASFSYDTEHVWTTPFFLVVLFTLAMTFYSLSIKESRNKYVLIALLSYLGISVFIVLTKYEATYFIFKKIPVLFMFRNPSKLTYLSTMFFGILLSNALTQFGKVSRFSKYAKYVPWGALVVTLVYIWPIFLGDRGLKRSGRDFALRPEYSQIVEKINTLRPGDGRSVWLPMTHEHTFIKLQWLDPTKFQHQIGINQFGERAYESDLVEAFEKAVSQTDIVTATNVLKSVQVDFAVVLKNEDFYKERPYTYKDLRELFSGLTPVEETDFHVLYQLGAVPDTVFAPKDVVTSNVSPGNINLAFSRFDPSVYTVALESQGAADAKIFPTDTYTFVTASQEAIPTENVFWVPEWTWDTPESFPTKVEKLSENEDFRGYILRLLVSNGEIAKYVTESEGLSEAQISRATKLYNEQQQEINVILDGLFREGIQEQFIDLTPAWYMYADRANALLTEKALVDASISYEYEYFVSRVNQFYENICESDYCYQFHLNKGSYDIEVYDLGPNNSDGIFSFNSQDLAVGDAYEQNPAWYKLGGIDVETGPVSVETNLDRVYMDHTFDEENNRILANNEDTKITYEVSFLYSFAENIDLDLYLKNKNREEYDSRDRVVERTLAGTYSNNFCHVVQGGRCYSRFSTLLSLNNTVESINVSFDGNVSSDASAPNHVRNIAIARDIFPVLSVDDRLSSPRIPPKVTYTKVSPVKYEVAVTEIADDFLLVFNKTFHPDWKLTSDTLGPAPEEVHVLSNYFANGWYVSKSNIGDATTMNFTIEFERQRLLLMSIALTAIVAVVGLGIVGALRLRGRKA